MKLNKVTKLTDYYCKNRDKLVKRYSYRAGGIPNAEDVVQEAFCRALHYIDSYQEDSKIAAWFNTILNNALKDFKRQERRQGMAVEEDRIIEDFHEYVHEQNLLDKILLEIDDMPEPSRTIVSHFVLLGYQAKEISQLMSVNLHTARKCIAMFYEDVRSRYSFP